VSAGDRMSPDSMTGRVTALHEAFDASFAAAAVPRHERREEFLAIRLGTDPYLLRLSEIVGLYADRRVVPVPSPDPRLLGIVGLRGRMAPVYDLAAFLGYSLATSPRWMVLASGALPVGFAFETFETHLRVSEALFASEHDHGVGAGEIRQHARGTVRVAGELRSVIHMASVSEMVGRTTHD
jgi:chemotaxis signal transduction protein